MITLKNVATLDGKVQQIQIASQEEIELDVQGLTLLPALIDPHVHFRTPGIEYKENWESGARAALYGGITTVFDMPNTLPPTITSERLEEKSALIDKQLKKCALPLHYGLYLGADKNHFDQIVQCKDKIVGLKVFMGSSTGDLVMDDDSSLHAIFSLAAAHDLLLAVHAEDEERIKERKKQFTGVLEPRMHSEIRHRDAAMRATAKAIELARLYGTRLYILHCGTKEEIALIRQAKREGLSVYVETTPHHLFLTVDDYSEWGTKVQMNPPLRTQDDVNALWEAIGDGTLDTIGSDHAPHTLEEKALPYGQSPSGIPGVETTLPLLLNASNEGKLPLKQIVYLMRERILEIFRLPPNEDWILIDMQKKRRVIDANLKTKCGWSPYAGRELQGWPVYTILRGRLHELN